MDPSRVDVVLKSPASLLSHHFYNMATWQSIDVLDPAAAFPMRMSQIIS